MDLIRMAINYINELGGILVMPFIIMIIGLIAGMGVKRSIRSGLLYAVGFQGILLVLDLFVGSFSPVIQQMAERMGIHLDVLGAGWMLGATMAFSSPLLPLSFVVIIAVNVILIMTNFVKTLDIDVWNYWTIIVGGILVQQATGSFWLGILVVAISAVIVLKLADRYAKLSWEVVDLAEGISLPHLDTITMAPIYIVVNKIIDKIPVIRDIDLSPERVQEKFGILGEPIFVGGILGVLIGIIAGSELKEVLELAFAAATAMLLLPRVAGILMEGLTPISEAVRDKIKTRLKDKEIYIGLDAAVAIGHPAVIAASILFFPMLLLLSVILPGNRMLPLGDFSSMPFTALWAIIASRGNLFRGLICGAIGCTIILLFASHSAELYTVAVQSHNIPLPEGAAFVSNVSAGNPLYFLWLNLFKFLGFAQ